MKQQRTKIFVAISSISLVIVLLIQINWIVNTAKIKEELFNEKANMVLSRTTEALRSDEQTYKNLELGIGKNEIHKIDSLFKYYMKFYNFYIAYSFEVINPGSVKPISVSESYGSGFKINLFPDKPGCYQKGLEQVANTNGMELKLIFPEKKQYILQEMGMPFISSVVLILVVLLMFWQTILSLIKEKRISEHTTDFLNNMTHEFKTPLTNIALAGKMIRKDSNEKPDNKINHYSEIILEENEKLKLQVEQVLSMTALERGEIPVNKTTLDFHDLIRGLIKSVNLQIENKQGSLKTELKAENSIITGDKTHLSNALNNLVDNAIKYSSGKPEITIQTSNIENNLRILVSDNGIGIEKNYQKKVFNKFFRVPTGDVHDVKGFGLGLAYIKKIIELHEGSITLESEKGKGSTFIFIIPNA